MLGGIKKMIKSWLDIQDAPRQNYTITEKYNFDTNAIKNMIWMRGDPYEIEQFYKTQGNTDAMFWGVVPHTAIRKIHTGLPGIIVDTLTSIVVRDMNDIELGARQDEWEQIEKDNLFKEIVKEALSKCLYLGDGAFKLSFDNAISNYPIIEFYGSNDVEIIYERGRFKEAVFKIVYTHNNRNYMLLETYGFGYIKNKLVKLPEEKEVPLNSIPQTTHIVDRGFAGYSEDKDGNVITKGTFCMATPFKIFDSPKWKGRGRSIFDTKVSAFDAFDEVFSQWMDALRAGRATKYIPDCLVPKNPKTGAPTKPNPFDNRYITTGNDMKEDGKNEIKLVQPAIPSENYLETYISSLDLCLQGLISPSTLGIDVKKLDNAEAQREKEKTTLYTRNKIIEALQDTLILLINNVFKANDTYYNKSLSEDIEIMINFGEYANPSFEAQVETVSKARTGGIMSLETIVDELYGDSKDDDWKAAEVLRLKEEQGIVELAEPAISNFNTEEEVEDNDSNN